ncbi:MAG: hypothetical protein JWO38_4920 [Gemmataceae bacterium]|nr:hypothetical protein [Gemmataceae bacterium]
MKRFALPGLACALAATFVGCGPMPTPMPKRFEGDTQKELDTSWDKAFTPAERFDHQGLLDVMVGTQAYQLGVDTFSLRAEKRVAGGKVVMQVSFDRARPADDRFEVTVYDSAGKLVRAERYSRKEVDATHDALFADPPPPKDPDVPDRPGMAARRAEYDARWKRIQEIFPRPKEGEPDGAPMPGAKK